MSSNSEQPKRKKRSVGRGRRKRRDGTPNKGIKLNPMDIMSMDIVHQLTEENSFLLNPAIPHAVYQQDVIFGQKRLDSTMRLHNHIFDNAFLQRLEDKDVLYLYSVSLSDVAKNRALNMKLTEANDKSIFRRDLAKAAIEIAKAKATANSIEDQHSSEMLHALLEDSLRSSMEDELEQKYGGSNSYKPIEAKDYDIIAVDPNADD